MGRGFAVPPIIYNISVGMPSFDLIIIYQIWITSFIFIRELSMQSLL